MKTLKIFAVSLLFSIGTAAANAQTAPVTPPAEIPSTTTAEPATTPPSDPAPTVVNPAAETVTEEPGRIIFFRPGRLSGAVYTYHVVKVGLDGKSDDSSERVCSLPNGRYCIFDAVPGVYNFNIRGPMAVNLAEDRIRLEVEPGQTYYIEQTVRIGLITGGFRLVPSSKEEFDRRKPREWKPGDK